MNADKLVRQIAELLASGNGAEEQGSQLAGEYVRLCHEANQRLEQCAAMIAKGSDYQALQLAESEPVLLDLVATLSFAGTHDWIHFCEENHLSIPEQLDRQAVTTLNALYAKGVPTNHPLYKDYRAAVSSREDQRALQIIKTINRLNPSDTDARSEMRRLENKRFQTVRAELQSALHVNDEAGTVRTVSELESLTSKQKLAELPEYNRAVAIRKTVLRRNSIVEARQLVRGLAEQSNNGEWQATGEALGSIRALQSEHEFDLDPADEEVRTKAQTYYDQKRAAAIQTARFESALNGVGELLNQVEHSELSRAGRRLEAVEDSHLSLTKKWRDLESFGKPVPEDLRTRVRRVATHLQSEVDRLKRQKRIVISVACFVTASVLAVGAWFALGQFQARDYATQLSALIAARQVSATEKMMANVTSEHRRLASVPVLRAKLDEGETWSRNERRARQEVDQSLSELETAAQNNFEQWAPPEVAKHVESITDNIAALPDELRGEAEARFARSRNAAEGRLAAAREALQRELESLVTTMEAIAAKEMSFDKPLNEVQRALEEHKSDFARMTDLANPSTRTLRPSEALISRADVIQKRATGCEHELERIEKTREQLRAATTLKAYQTALEGYRDSLFLQSEEVRAARGLLSAFPKGEDLLREVLLPGDPVAFATVKNDGGKMMPTDVLPAELSKLQALRDDDSLRNIWSASLTDHEHSRASHQVYSEGEISPPVETPLGDRRTLTWKSNFYDPKRSPDNVKFEPGQFTLTIFPMGGKRGD